MSLPADAPRIAFSLDNTIIGRIGITDATYQRAMFKAGGRLITLRPDAAGDPVVSPDAVKALLDEKEIDGITFNDLYCELILSGEEGEQGTAGEGRCKNGKTGKSGRRGAGRIREC